MSATIAALATPPGKGGVGVIRISGPEVRSVAQGILHKIPQPRYAEKLKFYDNANQVLDEGIALFFPSPNSFTGEDVLELQGHGGPVILDLLLQRILEFDVRIAKPGEFSERAFLNDKLDLAQAEAIADLIDSASAQAARSAIRSLQGEFSNIIECLAQDIIHLRMYIEAAIDFPEEEIDFINDEKVLDNLKNIQLQIKNILQTAEQGVLLRDGITIVIAGRPNAGKSTLLNKLCGKDVAIVTPIPGTTRDVLREYIHLDGMPVHIIDTAGLRKSEDEVEQVGIERALQEIENADKILFIIDGQLQKIDQHNEQLPDFFANIKNKERIIFIYNKADISKVPIGIHQYKNKKIINLSAKTGEGIDLLKQHLKQEIGYQEQQDGFIARRRHIQALERAQQFVTQGKQQLQTFNAGELLAEDLRNAHSALAEITGEFTADDLLGEIFSSFCIGK